LDVRSGPGWLAGRRNACAWSIGLVAGLL
jgi:hypothetical protein